MQPRNYAHAIRGAKGNAVGRLEAQGLLGGAPFSRSEARMVQKRSRFRHHASYSDGGSPLRSALALRC